MEETKTETAENCCDAFDFEQARQAITALQQHVTRANSSSNVGKDLFNDDQSMYLDVVMKKYPVHLPAVSFLEVPLPHPFHDPKTASSCIIVRDLDKRPPRLDLEKSSRIYKDFFSEKYHLTEPTEVVSVKQLLSEHKTYEAKRKLCHSYDIFIADARLGGHITKWLGKEFIHTKKVPFLINVTKRVEKNFRRVFTLTRAVLTPSTLKFTVKIGRLNQPADHLLENLQAITTNLDTHMPGKWLNVRSAYVSLPSVMDLPVYIDWGSTNSVTFPNRQPRNATFVKGELTTLRTADDDDHEQAPPVRVYSDGSVRVGKPGRKRQRRETHWKPPRKLPAKAKGRKLPAKAKGRKLRGVSVSKVKRETEVEEKRNLKMDV